MSGVISLEEERSKKERCAAYAYRSGGRRDRCRRRGKERIAGDWYCAEHAVMVRRGDRQPGAAQQMMTFEEHQ